MNIQRIGCQNQSNQMVNFKAKVTGNEFLDVLKSLPTEQNNKAQKAIKLIEKSNGKNEVFNLERIKVDTDWDENPIYTYVATSKSGEEILKTGNCKSCLDFLKAVTKKLTGISIK